jgi:hypothetical protein
VVVSAVAGLAGVGKTTLAVAAGHAARRRGWYRGGVLFIDLHGYDDQRTPPRSSGRPATGTARAWIPSAARPPLRTNVDDVRDGEPPLCIKSRASARHHAHLVLCDFGKR